MSDFLSGVAAPRAWRRVGRLSLTVLAGLAALGGTAAGQPAGGEAVEPAGRYHAVL